MNSDFWKFRVPPEALSLNLTVPTENSISAKKRQGTGPAETESLGLLVHDCFACRENRRGVSFSGVEDGAGVHLQRLY